MLSHTTMRTYGQRFTDCNGPDLATVQPPASRLEPSERPRLESAAARVYPVSSPGPREHSICFSSMEAPEATQDLAAQEQS